MQYRQVHLPVLLESQGLSRDVVVRVLFLDYVSLTVLTFTSMTRCFIMQANSQTEGYREGMYGCTYNIGCYG